VRLLLQLGRLEPTAAATASMLCAIMDQPFFHSLRTEQQLGYIVGAGCTASSGVYSLSFVVQSAREPPAEVSRRILAFLDELPARVANTTADEFADFAASERRQLLEPPKRLSQAGEQLWAPLAEQTRRFEWPERVAEAVALVKPADVAALAKRVAQPSGGGVGRLFSLVHGNKHTLQDANPPFVPTGYTLVTSTDAFRKDAKYFPPLVSEA
jgi:secreted Zn-dependent insulinase-like peptidase